MLSLRRILLLISILFTAAILGCTQKAAVVPDREKRSPQPVIEEKPSTSPTPVSSKGSGIKKRMPVKVKTGDRLGWVDNALKTYPPEQFITGLGIAPDRKTAQARALQELAKPFGKAISGRIRMRRETVGKLPGPLIQEWNSLAEKGRIDALETALAQARVAEIFIEKQPQPTIYALAVLSRDDSIRLLHPMIQRLDRQLPDLIKQIERSSDRVPAEGNTLLQAFIHREALDAALSIAQKGGQGIPLPVQPQIIGHLLKEK